MTKDLEMTLQELGPGYKAVVDRLQAGALPAFEEGRRHFPQPVFPRLLAAASVSAALLGISAFYISDRHTSGSSEISKTPCNEYSLAEICDERAVEEIIRTQKPDGSWQTDFLTRRNAAALSSRTEAKARIAYKKARRNLRNRGLL